LVCRNSNSGKTHHGCSNFHWFYRYIFQILEPAKRLSSAISNIQGGIPALQRVLEVLDYDLKVEEIENPIAISTLNDKIEFKNVILRMMENIKF
jgi:subfamily B ATP-binding cassette protein MsbA